MSANPLKRKAYVCGKCGEPKKGHVCGESLHPAPDHISAPTDDLKKQQLPPPQYQQSHSSQQVATSTITECKEVVENAHEGITASCDQTSHSSNITFSSQDPLKQDTYVPQLPQHDSMIATSSTVTLSKRGPCLTPQQNDIIAFAPSPGENRKMLRVTAGTKHCF
jgi:hypothetical protein